MVKNLVRKKMIFPLPYILFLIHKKKTQSHEQLCPALYSNIFNYNKLSISFYLLLHLCSNIQDHSYFLTYWYARKIRSGLLNTENYITSYLLWSDYNGELFPNMYTLFLQGRSQIVNAFDYISNVTSSDREFYFIFQSTARVCHRLKNQE